jgi:dipeptidase
MPIRVDNPYIVSFLLFFLFSAPVHACTSFIITPGASADGSMYVGYSNDALWVGTMKYVPSADHAMGSKRAVPFDPSSSGARVLNGSKIAYIDEVNHTYGYLVSSYGIMNEHQLMVGEGSSSTKTIQDYDCQKRIFFSSELSKIALERCTKSKHAVELAGHLIDTYGYYGVGETLIFADPNEVWVMEMCSSPNGTGGLWAARKVPDGEIFVSANTFRIREIDPKDHNLLYSKNLFRVAEAEGWWRPKDGPLDWMKTVSTGECSHPYSSLGRIWSIYHRFASSLNLSPYVEDTWSKDYPFSAKPDRKLTTKDALNVLRDHYEGTVYDMTKGLAAGPYGNPYRDIGNYDPSGVVVEGNVSQGAWSRPVSSFRCMYSYVAQGRASHPDPIGGVCWFGFAQPYETCYMPIYCGVRALPMEFGRGNMSVFDLTSPWWTFNFVTNWATLRYDDIKKDIQSEQARIESREIINQPVIDRLAEKALKARGSEACSQYLTNYSINNSLSVLGDWQRLANRLVVNYTCGMIKDPNTGQYRPKGYPNWWLNETGYQYGPRIYEYSEALQMK